MSFQKTILCGEITTDPELRWNQAQIPCCAFRLKTVDSWLDERGQPREKSETHKVIVWGRDAERVSKEFKKGQLAVIEGKLQTRVWKAENGLDIDITEVVAVPNGVRFCGPSGFTAQRPTDGPSASKALPQNKEAEGPRRTPGSGEPPISPVKPAAAAENAQQPKKPSPVKPAPPKPDKVHVDLAVEEDLPF